MISWYTHRSVSHLDTIGEASSCSRQKPIQTQQDTIQRVRDFGTISSKWDQTPPLQAQGAMQMQRQKDCKSQSRLIK